MSLEASLARRLAAAEAEAERWKRHARALEDVLRAEADDVAAAWGLPVRQAALFALLTRREIVTRAQAHAALYGARGDELHAYCVDTVMRHLRRSLRPRGVEVFNVYGVGWKLSPQARARLRARPGDRAEEGACAA